MQVALDNLAAISAGHKTLILGDMFELGEETEQEHQRIVEYALKINAHRTIFIGKAFSASNQNNEGVFFPDIQSAIEGIKSNPVSGSTILLKGSRGMKLEMLLPLL
jgi:UDP-N-acetylmuramoyl-tripeptide--D-alanyl-D-alanine ligase